MPALPNVNKVVRLDLFFTVGVNSRVRDRMFFSFTGAGPTLGDLPTWLTTTRSAWTTNMSPAQHSSATLTQLMATDLTSQSGAQQVLSASASGTITAAGSAPSAGVAVIIKFKIARRYRGGHPRFYMPGPGMNNLADSEHWATGYVSAIQADFAAFVAAAVTTPPTNLGTMAHVSVSYFAGFTNKTFPSGRTHPISTPRGTPTQDPVIAYSVNPIIGSQRRRNQQSP